MMRVDVYEPRMIHHKMNNTTRKAITVAGMAIWRFTRYHAYDRNRASGREDNPRCERTRYLGSI